VTGDDRREGDNGVNIYEYWLDKSGFVRIHEK